MDDFSRHHPSSHHNNISSSQFRISPVNFGGSARHNNSGGSHILTTGVFGSSVLPQSLYGRGLTPSLITPSAPPNHFNFPLRSNAVNNGGCGRGLPGVGNAPNSGGQIFKGVNVKPNSGGQNFAKSKPGNQALGEERKSEPEPQYRIFKRGDTIPGINSPVMASSHSQDAEDSSPNPNYNRSHEETLDPQSANAEGQNKENSSLSGDKGNEGRTGQPNKTPVSSVTDLARFHGLSVEYRLVGEKGPPHNPTFTVSLHLGPNEEYTGQGSSIKRAQHAAAVEALENTELSRPTPRTQPRKNFTTGAKRPNWALLQLTSIADDLKEPVSIVQQPITIMDPFRRNDPPCIVSVHVGDRIFTGEGPNFNAAKNMAAMIALKAMMKVKQEFEMKKLAENPLGIDANGQSIENKSPISLVHELAMKRGLTVGFEVTKEEGPPHSKVFTVVCTLGNSVTTTEGQGPTKQLAKKSASELMISKLTVMPITVSALPIASSFKAIQRGLLRQKSPRKKNSAPVLKDLDKQTVSPISRLIQIAHIRKYKEPEFILVASSAGNNPGGEDPQILKGLSERERRNLRKKKPSFTMEVKMGPHSFRGIGPNKKAAKKAAAEATLIELGYGPTPADNSSNDGANEKSNGSSPRSSETSKPSKNKDSSKPGPANALSGRQLVPGVLVLNSDKDSSGSPVKTSAIVQEAIKINSSSSSTTNSDATEKLTYLAKLLNANVSYSDFPKKNEFLSVVSLCTNPPQVAHGCGATLQEARNKAAEKVMEDLSDIGLDNVNVNPGESGFP